MVRSMPVPVRALPRVFNAGIFWHGDRDFAVRYQSPTHALHVYLYACEMRLDDAMFTIEEHDLTLSPAGSGSSYHLDRPGRHWCIHWHPPEADGPRVALPVHQRLGRRGEYVGERVAHIARLHARALSGAGDIAAAAAAAALQELLLRLALDADAPRGAASAADAAVERVAALLIERLAEPLSVPRIAREVGVSQTHLARRFRSRFGMTMPRFLLSRRIERARQLLMSTDLAIGAVAAAVGLPDAQHFNKQFRRFVGHSPSAERRR